MLLRLYKVKGESMSPTILAGDYLVSLKRIMNPYKVGDIIVIHHEGFGDIIKRVCAVDPIKGVRLVGENKFSISTQEIRWQLAEAILGRMVLHITRP